ncbi:MAG: nucleoside-diphosphate kinase [Candidatus Altiarchaeota archaeon]|nr:nucleoside-diphosphate kinase [Candidatus Altiarchaeota archaeon]
MAIEKTFVGIKPDGVRRGLLGECLKRFENYDIRVIGLKIINISREKAERLYSIHKEKPFYNDLLDYVTSSPIVVAVLKIDLEPANAIKLVRKIVGATDPVDSERGSIRGDYGFSITQNIVHASDSEESAAYEIPIFFDENEFVKY